MFKEKKYAIDCFWGIAVIIACYAHLKTKDYYLGASKLQGDFYLVLTMTIIIIIANIINLYYEEAMKIKIRKIFKIET